MYEITLKVKVVRFADKESPKFHLHRVQKKWMKGSGALTTRENGIILKKLGRYKLFIQH